MCSSTTITVSNFPHLLSHGAWWFGRHSSVMLSNTTLNLWTMDFTLNLEVFEQWALPLLSLQFSGIRKEIQSVWEVLSSTIVYNIWTRLGAQSITSWIGYDSRIFGWTCFILCKGQSYVIIGNSDAYTSLETVSHMFGHHWWYYLPKKRLGHEFLSVWTTTPFMTSKNGTP